MEQPIASLNLSKVLIDGFHKAGFNYCCEVDRAFDDPSTTASLPLDQTEWRRLTKAPESKTALDLLEEEYHLGYTPTCIKELDDLLEGGITTGVVTEFTGTPGSGRTQLCLHLCVNVQLPKWCGGLNGEALYIDTNRKFAKQRLKEIALKSIQKYSKIKQNALGSGILNDNFNLDDILKKIHYIRVDDCTELLTTVECLHDWLSQQKSIRLIIINSVTTPLRQFESEHRSEIIDKLITNLQVLAQIYQFSTIFTNDMTTKVDTNGPYRGPSLGDKYYHRINTRIELSKEKSDNVFRAKIVKSVLHACDERIFHL